LSAAIAGQLAVLLVVGGGAPQEAHGSRLGPLNGTSEWSDGGPLRLLSEPLPGFVQRAHELGLGVIGRVPDVIDWHERIPWGLPVSLERGWVSSEFGMRMHPVLHKRCMHEGIDLAVDAGEVVRSTARGVVTFADERGGYGLLVIVDHENGMTTRYAHLSKFLVGVGDHVERGERLGLSGATGRVTGEHLHYEVRIEGEAVNPRSYLPEGLPDERPPGM